MTTLCTRILGLSSQQRRRGLHTDSRVSGQRSVLFSVDLAVAYCWLLLRRNIIFHSVSGEFFICDIFILFCHLCLIYVMANLSTNERVEIILLCGREGWSLQNVADEFSRLHPDLNIVWSLERRLNLCFNKGARHIEPLLWWERWVNDKINYWFYISLSQQNWGVTPSIITVNTCNVKLRKVRIISYFHT